MNLPDPQSTLLDIKETTEHVLECGKTRYWTLDPLTDRWRLVVYWCRSHLCSECAARKSRRHGYRIRHQMGDKPTHHLILTIRRSHGPLRPVLDSLFRGFKELRRAADWKRQVIGGVRFLHVAFDDERQQWGPHFDCLIETRGLSIEWLRSR